VRMGMKGVWAVPIVFGIALMLTMSVLPVMADHTPGIVICGDGHIEGIEECDNGTDNSDLQPDACRTNCVLPACGDGVIDQFTGLVPEECDDGNQNHDLIPDRCRTTCDLPACGDGVIDSGEQCDDGNAIDDDDCTNSCLLTLVATCVSDLATCEGDLTDTEDDLTTCEGDLMSCEDDLADTEADLATTQGFLDAAEEQIAEFLEILQSGEIEVCHNDKTKVVTLGGLGGHLAHGDTIGAC